MKGCQNLGVQVLTLYCLSSENWKRPTAELEFLMALLKQYLIAERAELVSNNLRLRIIGTRDKLPAEVQAEMDLTLNACSSNTGMTLCLAINYGSRNEIVRAVQLLAQQVEQGLLDPQTIDERLISDHLDTAGLPDPDLLIRTSGEMRISNYLLWQISYSELWVTPTLWPEFDQSHLQQAVQAFASRNRRFGGLSSSRSL
jgi:undecaprenyl diphosphate synthase